MTTPGPRRSPASSFPPQIGGHPIVEPGEDQLWCEANPGLFTVLLAQRPPSSDTTGMRDYRDGIAAARHMCEHLCPRFKECLQAATGGPPVAGFVAGQTETERDRHRAHLRMGKQREPVDDWFVGLGHNGSKRPITDHAAIDEVIRRMPEASAATIARHVDASASTVKRRKRAVAAEDATGRRPAETTYESPSLADHVDTYYLIRESAS